MECLAWAIRAIREMRECSSQPRADWGEGQDFDYALCVTPAFPNDSLDYLRNSSITGTVTFGLWTGSLEK